MHAHRHCHVLTTTVFAIVATGCVLQACGGGIPVRIRIDSVTIPVDIDSTFDAAIASFSDQVPLLEALGTALPARWPESLGSVYLEEDLVTPAQDVDLTPTDPEDAKKYKTINRVQDAIERIEINDLVLRVEQNTLTVALPKLYLQLSRELTPKEDDPDAFDVIGTIPGTDPTNPSDDVDLALEFVPGGESRFNAEVGDEAKEFSLRVKGKVVFDSRVNPNLPRGSAVIRVIVVVTFFVKPEALY